MQLLHALKDLHKEHKKMIVIDFTNADYVSSMGYGVLLAEYKKKNLNIKVVLPKANVNVYDIAEKLNLKSFFPVVETIKDI
jgi:anti-anti-sigma factor